MKKIEIKGKHQKDKINKANYPTNKNIIATRDCMEKLPDEVFNYNYQVNLLNKIFLDYDNKIEYANFFLREIDKKLNRYKTQDINKVRYNEKNITQEQTIEKLV